MVVASNASWKIPVGYFLISGMNGSERANLVKTCLKKLHEVGIEVISLTCDGPSCNFGMISQLGASLDVENFKTFFPHPLDQDKKVFIMLDICHMIKLERNTLGKGLILVDKDGGKISWQYIVDLEKIQRVEGLRLGNFLAPPGIYILAPLLTD